MPVWHASVSLVAPGTGRRRNRERDVEAHAIRALAGVGGDTEWWYWSPARIGHLRVALHPRRGRRAPTVARAHRRRWRRGRPPPQEAQRMKSAHQYVLEVDDRDEHANAILMAGALHAALSIHERGMSVEAEYFEGQVTGRLIVGVPFLRSQYLLTIERIPEEDE